MKQIVIVLALLMMVSFPNRSAYADSAYHLEYDRYVLVCCRITGRDIDVAEFHFMRMQKPRNGEPLYTVDACSRRFNRHAGQSSRYNQARAPIKKCLDRCRGRRIVFGDELPALTCAELKSCRANLGKESKAMKKLSPYCRGR